MDSDSVFSVEANKCVCSSNIDIFDNGYFWEVRVGDKPIFLIPKEEPGRYLRRYISLPPPNNISREDADAILLCIERCSSRGESANGRGYENQAIYFIKLPEEILRGRAKIVLTKVAFELATQVVEVYGIKVPVVNDTPLGIFCYDDGAYIECGERLLNALQHYYTYYDLEKKGVSYRSLKAEFLAHVRDYAKVFRGFDHHLLLFRNGIFDWDRFVGGDNPRIEPCPEYMILHRVDHEVNWSLLSDKSCFEGFEKCVEGKAPFFMNVFKSWVDDKWILLFEVIGYVFYTGSYPFNKAVMLVGEGSNGKSTYLALLKSILGSRNITSITLQEIESNRFAGAELFGKMANIYADLPNEMLRQSGKFKILTGEDYVCFDRKYSRKRICFTNYAKLIFSCNTLPVVQDTSLAFWRRWIVVEFPNQFPDNPKFKEEVVRHGEIPSLIALSILAFRRVLERGMFSYQEKATDYKEVWMRRVEPVYDFLRFLEERGYGARDANSRVEEKELYNIYTNYHETFREDSTLPKKTFTERLESYGIYKKRTSGKRYYVGIALMKTPIEIIKEIKREAEEQTTNTT